MGTVAPLSAGGERRHPRTRDATSGGGAGRLSQVALAIPGVSVDNPSASLVTLFYALNLCIGLLS